MCKELISAIKQLKELLGDGGEYSVCRSDKKPMNLPDALFIGSVFEKIDVALQQDNPVDENSEAQCLCPRYFGDCEDCKNGKCESPLI